MIQKIARMMAYKFRWDYIYDTSRFVKKNVFNERRHPRKF